MDAKAKLLRTSLITDRTRPVNQFKKDISAQIFEREFMAERDKTKFNPVESDLPIPKFPTRPKYGFHKSGMPMMRQAPESLTPEYLRSSDQPASVPPLPEGQDENPQPLSK
jgi:hypothetical protein